MLIITIFNRDFGPILTAERKALPDRPTLPGNLINTKPAGQSSKAQGGGGLCPNPVGGSDIGSDSETEKVELRGSGSIGGNSSPDTSEQEYAGE